MSTTGGPIPRAAAPAHASRAVRAELTLLVAFDVAAAIDLAAAEKLLAVGGGAHRQGIGPSNRGPAYLDYRPLPLRLSGSVEPVAVGEGAATEPVSDAVIFDFGAVSLTYRLRYNGPLGGLLGLSEALAEPPAVIAAARGRLRTLISALAPAISRPAESELMECYLIVQIVDGDLAVTARGREIDGLLAGVLRSERRALSEDEIADANSARIAYSPDDLALIDWNAAVLIDRESGGSDDVRAVLEYANVELLEMRVLDDRLDHILDESYRAVTEETSRRAGLGRILPWPGRAGPLGRVAQMQMDAALLYEGVNNAIKLVGDQYLARVYRLAANRFHLPERDQNIERKLRVLEGIYAKLEDWQAAVRMEVLEWIIIILIAVSIVLPFLLPGGK